MASNVTLIAAFINVFGVHDIVAETTVMSVAMRELDKMGVSSAWATDRLCGLPEEQSALILIKACLAEFLIGLQDDNDWSVVMLDSGHLSRVRSFSAVRFAVLECLLIVAVVALGWSVWIHK